MLSLVMLDSRGIGPLTDDLSAPLGQGGRDQSGIRGKLDQWAAAVPVAALRALAGALGCFAIVFLGWALFADAPFGGEPMAVVSVDLHADTAGPDTQPVEANPGRTLQAHRQRP